MVIFVLTNLVLFSCGDIVLVCDSEMFYFKMQNKNELIRI